MKNSGENTDVLLGKKKLPCDLKVFELKGKKRASKDQGLSHLPFGTVLISRGKQKHIHLCTDSPLK